jgi:MraZ protein
MFRGHFEHTVDDKGRVAIPARFREVLSGLQEERLVVTKFVMRGKRCLDAYPFGAWRQLEVRLQARRRFDPRLVSLRNYYVSGAYECQLDGQGRILLPQYLREHAGIDREVAFAGDIDKFRLWDKDTWQQAFAADEQAVLENPDLWGDLDL